MRKHFLAIGCLLGCIALAFGLRDVTPDRPTVVVKEREDRLGLEDGEREYVLYYRDQAFGTITVSADGALTGRTLHVPSEDVSATLSSTDKGLIAATHFGLRGEGGKPSYSVMDKNMDGLPDRLIEYRGRTATAYDVSEIVWHDAEGRLVPKSTIDGIIGKRREAGRQAGGGSDGQQVGRHPE